MLKKSELPVYTPFNPLDKRHLGASAANALLTSEIHNMPPEPFIAAGVYAIYYTGDFPAYQVLAEVNRNDQYACPIYVGKAVPDGARKGGQGDNVDPGTALYKRLTDHTKSIASATNLDLSDFHCRFLSVDDIWIPLTESLLIEWFKPVWNCVLDGFGNHDPGKGRYSGRMPFWDCLHPGRSWAKKLQPCLATPKELEEKIKHYLEETLL